MCSSFVVQCTLKLRSTSSVYNCPLLMLFKMALRSSLWMSTFVLRCIMFKDLQNPIYFTIVYFVFLIISYCKVYSPSRSHLDTGGPCSVAMISAPFSISAPHVPPVEVPRTSGASGARPGKKRLRDKKGERWKWWKVWDKRRDEK